jgi:hypothetical protein
MCLTPHFVAQQHLLPLLDVLLTRTAQKMSLVSTIAVSALATVEIMQIVRCRTIIPSALVNQDTLETHSLAARRVCIYFSFLFNYLFKNLFALQYNFKT